MVKVNAIPGHSLTLGALGVLHPLVRLVRLQRRGSNQRPSELASIFLTTTVAPAVATVTMHALHLDPQRQARCIHVPERFSGWPGRRDRWL